MYVISYGESFFFIGLDWNEGWMIRTFACPIQIAERMKKSLLFDAARIHSLRSLLLFFFFFVLQRIARRERKRWATLAPQWISSTKICEWWRACGSLHTYMSTYTWISRNTIMLGKYIRKSWGEFIHFACTDPNKRERERKRVDLHNAIQLAFEFNLNAWMPSVYIYRYINSSLLPSLG